jgi:hypothetical protein
MNSGSDYRSDDYADERAWFPTSREVLAWLARRWEWALCLGAVAAAAGMVALLACRWAGHVHPVQPPW